MIGGSDSSWTPFVLFRVACARRGGVPRQTCNFPWVFLWVVLYDMALFLDFVWGFAMCLPVCFRGTVVDSSMALPIMLLFLTIPTINSLHTGPMYVTRERPKPFFRIYLSLPLSQVRQAGSHTHGLPKSLGGSA